MGVIRSASGGDAMSEWDGKTERRQETLVTQQAILLKLDVMDEKMSRVCTFIDGNGKPERGAVVRLDRLEQTEKSRLFHIRMLWTATAGVAARALWETFRR